jgi:hypothetical protein
MLLPAGCANEPFPEFPEIEYHYVVEVRMENPLNIGLLDIITNPESIEPMAEKEVVRCLKFGIVNKIPYEIKYLNQAPMAECNYVGGYKPRDSQLLYNWFSDVYTWGKLNKKW